MPILDASQYTSKTRSKLGNARIDVMLNFFLRCSKLLWVAFVHSKAQFFMQEASGVAMVLNCAMNR